MESLRQWRQRQGLQVVAIVAAVTAVVVAVVVVVVGVVMAVVATGGVAVLASMFEHACWVGRQKAKVSCSHVARDRAHNVKVTGVFA